MSLSAPRTLGRSSLVKAVISSACIRVHDLKLNPLRPNSDLCQTSHCNIKGLSVSEVTRTENMITQITVY